MRRLALATALLTLPACAQTSGLDAPPGDRVLFDGRLRVVDVAGVQARALRETRGLPADAVLDRLVRDAYAPYAAFWAGYLGDEDAFREWATGALLDAESPVEARLDSAHALGLMDLFERGAAWVEAQTGHAPEGTWYLVYGPGWTDMGGLGEIGMVADLSAMTLDPERLQHLVVHEMIHLAHSVTPARAQDPDRGTVLDRIVSEGLATYAAYVHAAGAWSPADAVHYSPGEWAWMLAHEPDLQAAAAPLLDSRDRADLDRVSSRGQSVLDPGVGAPGYGLGFRIVEAYAAARGSGSWAEALDLPVREVLRRSGYPLAAR